MKKSEKPFDAVQLMRQLRDTLSEQMKDMNFEEQKRYMKERLAAARPPREPRPESGTQAA
ncbi:MAG TPA: hypothetical protein VKK81_03135 [Candidatus Binatia bacterium]|nr:hypothetical protein [Candidatus Binatia bacterium]